MAEEKMQAAKVLLKNPYRQVILQDYNKTLESHKFRKKAEEIENELSWFTGKSSQYRASLNIFRSIMQAKSMHH